MLFNSLLVGLGGSAGCVLRYLVSVACLAAFGKSFPVGTLVVNVVGCLLIGILGRVTFGPTALAEPWRLALVIGFLGGLTTFSSFGLETFLLLEAQHVWRAASYVLASNILGLVAVFVGWRLAG